MRRLQFHTVRAFRGRPEWAQSVPTMPAIHAGRQLGCACELFWVLLFVETVHAPLLQGVHFTIEIQAKYESFFIAYPSYI